MLNKAGVLGLFTDSQEIKEAIYLFRELGTELHCLGSTREFHCLQ